MLSDQYNEIIELIFSAVFTYRIMTKYYDQKPYIIVYFHFSQMVDQGFSIMLRNEKITKKYGLPSDNSSSPNKTVSSGRFSFSANSEERFNRKIRMDVESKSIKISRPFSEGVIIESRLSQQMKEYHNYSI